MKSFIIFIAIALSSFSFAKEVFVAKEKNCSVSYDTKTLQVKGKCVPYYRSASGQGEVRITCSNQGFDCSGSMSNPKQISALSLLFDSDGSYMFMSKISLCSGRLIDRGYSCFGYVPNDMDRILEEQQECEAKMQKQLSAMFRTLILDENTACRIEESKLTKWKNIK